MSAHALAIAGQPVFAGAYLSGAYDWLWPHRWGADLVSYLSYLQVLAALWWWLGKGPRWLFGVSLLLVAGGTAQYLAGMKGMLDLHVPLGVALVTGVVLTTVAVWRPQRGRVAA